MCESNLDARKKTRRLVGLPVFSHYGSLHRCLVFIQNPASLTPWSSPQIASAARRLCAGDVRAKVVCLSQICRRQTIRTCSPRSSAAPSSTRSTNNLHNNLQRMCNRCSQCTTCCCSLHSSRGRWLLCLQHLQRPFPLSRCPLRSRGGLERNV